MKSLIIRLFTLCLFIQPIYSMETTPGNVISPTISSQESVWTKWIIPSTCLLGSAATLYYTYTNAEKNINTIIIPALDPVQSIFSSMHAYFDQLANHTQNPSFDTDYKNKLQEFSVSLTSATENFTQQIPSSNVFTKPALALGLSAFIGTWSLAKLGGNIINVLYPQTSSAPSQPRTIWQLVKQYGLPALGLYVSATQATNAYEDLHSLKTATDVLLEESKRYQNILDTIKNCNQENLYSTLNTLHEQNPHFCYYAATPSKEHALSAAHSLLWILARNPDNNHMLFGPVREAPTHYKNIILYSGLAALCTRSLVNSLWAEFA